MNCFNILQFNSISRYKKGYALGKRAEILKVINYFIESEISDKSNYTPLIDESSLIGDSGIDSFDFIMVFLKVGEVYGIDDKVFKEKLGGSNPSIKTIIDFLEEHHSVYKTFDEAIKGA